MRTSKRSQSEIPDAEAAMKPRPSNPPRSLMWFLMMFVLFPHTLTSPPVGRSETGDERSRADSAELPETREARERMVQEQIFARGIRDPRVLEALRKVPRHRFVPPEMQPSAYEDSALPIGLGQTISQPYVVAFMTEALELKPQDRVLEIGTGSGYQAAVLSLLAREVYSMEIVERLGMRGGGAAEANGLCERARPDRRWLPRLAGSGALRRHHCDGSAARRAARARRATPPRRPHGGSGGPLRAGFDPPAPHGERPGTREPAARALCSHGARR